MVFEKVGAIRNDPYNATGPLRRIHPMSLILAPYAASAVGICNPSLHDWLGTPYACVVPWCPAVDSGMHACRYSGMHADGIACKLMALHVDGAARLSRGQVRIKPLYHKVSDL